MAELSLTCPNPASNNTGASNLSILKRVLFRTQGHFPANTTLDVNNPGTGWVSSGDLLTISGATDFIDNTQVYRGGQLLLTGVDASADNDVYFVSAGSSIAFEHPIVKNEVLQIWQFITTSG